MMQKLLQAFSIAQCVMTGVTAHRPILGRWAASHIFSASPGIAEPPVRLRETATRPACSVPPANKTLTDGWVLHIGSRRASSTTPWKLRLRSHG